MVGKDLGQGFSLLFLISISLQECRQSCGVGNRAQDMGYNLPLLGGTLRRVCEQELGGEGLTWCPWVWQTSGKTNRVEGRKWDTRYGMQFTAVGVTFKGDG